MPKCIVIESNNSNTSLRTVDINFIEERNPVMKEREDIILMLEFGCKRWRRKEDEGIVQGALLQLKSRVHLGRYWNVGMNPLRELLN